MSNMKCPFCQQEYIITKDDSCFGQQRCVCRNPNCEFDGWHFPVKLVSKLIRTRKALDVAVDVLKLVYQGNGDPQDIMRYKDNRWTAVRRLCMQALAEITALEQKDVK